MSLREALILRAASVWTLWIWGTRILNILKNPTHSTSFKAVHTVLALVSVAFAVATWVIAGKNRRRLNQDNGLPSAERTGGPEGARRAV